jgi:hypothetical protein
LKTAQTNDVIGLSFYVDTQLNQHLAAEWENKLYDHLRKNGVVFFTEEEQRAKGYTVTLDCIICLDSNEVTIQGRSINWIEMKKTYVSMKNSL